MNVVWHDNKFVQEIFPLIAIVEQDLDQKSRPSFDTKDRRTLPRHRRNKKRALRLHAPERRSVRTKSGVTSVTLE